MSIHSFKMPDLGEGTVAAEIVAWHVKAGDEVVEGQTIAEVSTDKAVVEIPAPVTGRVRSLAGEPGNSIPVGAELISFDTSGAPKAQAPAAAPTIAAVPASGKVPVLTEAHIPAKAPLPSRASPSAAAAARVMTSPATRRRAREAGVDLQAVQGSGPGGRIKREDLDAVLATPRVADVEEIRVIGVRRLIAQRMSEAKRTIPHFSYVEEVDVTELESLRAHQSEQGGGKLTLLPFVVAALVQVLREFPQCNAHYDAAKEVIRRYRHVHVGIATQTPDGLKVPVVRDADQRTLADIAAEIRRVAEAARTNKATPAMLSGSTITVTSLGKLGGIASTPILNAPEVAIIGLNRMAARPVVRAGVIAIRQMMNLSSSFDHRFVDGFDAAAMIQALKGRLEHPATIFLQG
jgi:2-oxoisovalerate dehydrogenase E2 component (dihydrolipoyl transacylase)